MEDLKFKDVMHHYINCHVLAVDGTMPTLGSVNNKDGVVTLRRENDLHDLPVWSYAEPEEFKPILFPLSAMTSEQEYQLTKIRDSFGIIKLPSWHMIQQAAITKQLCEWHFNVFNLPESEYIDASKLPVNPYSKPNH